MGITIVVEILWEDELSCLLLRDKDRMVELRTVNC